MANSKLLLFGEYSVLFSKKSIGASIERFKTSCVFIEKKTNRIKIISRIQDKNTKKVEEFLESKFDIKGYLNVKSNVYPDLGLGSSASFSISIIQSLKEKLNLNDKDIFKYSKAIENIFHSRSSGVDIMLSMQKRGFYKIDLQENSLQSIDIFNDYSFLVFSIKREKKSFDSIKNVILDPDKRINLDKLAFYVNFFFDSKNIDDKIFYDYINQAHLELKDMSLSTKKLELIRDFILEKGLSPACKLSGAGCGGSFFAVSKGRSEAKSIIEKVKSFCRKKDIELLNAFII